MSQLMYKGDLLARTRRIVVKVGSAVLSDSSGLRIEVVKRLAAQLDAIVRGGREVVLVTSGAVAAGRARLGLQANHRKLTIAERQAAAATGQIELMAQYADHFRSHGRAVAQILLTHDDLADRGRCNNARHTINTLLAGGVIPIVNENDTVAVEEIRFGDNDNLSALVANLIQAQLLIILTDVPGVMSGDPRTKPDARLIPLITDAEAEMKGLVTEASPQEGPSPARPGTGGIASKLRAARQAVRAGVAVAIVGGKQPEALLRCLEPDAEEGTLILPMNERLKSRKHWIAFALKPTGSLHLDRGAAEAVRTRGRSLLPSGIRAVEGEFAGGDCVSLLDAEGKEFGRGLVNYPAADVLKVKGLKSEEIARTLGYKVADEVIHRDNLVLL